MTPGAVRGSTQRSSGRSLRRDIDQLKSRLSEEEKKEEEALFVSLKRGAPVDDAIQADRWNHHDRLAAQVQADRAPGSGQLSCSTSKSSCAAARSMIAACAARLRAPQSCPHARGVEPHNLVRRDRTRETLQLKLADHVRHDHVLDRSVHPLTNKDLPCVAVSQRRAARFVTVPIAA